MGVTRFEVLTAFVLKILQAMIICGNQGIGVEYGD